MLSSLLILMITHYVHVLLLLQHRPLVLSIFRHDCFPPVIRISVIPVLRMAPSSIPISSAMLRFVPMRSRLIFSMKTAAEYHGHLKSSTKYPTKSLMLCCSLRSSPRMSSQYQCRSAPSFMLAFLAFSNLEQHLRPLITVCRKREKNTCWMSLVQKSFFASMGVLHLGVEIFSV